MQELQDVPELHINRLILYICTNFLRVLLCPLLNCFSSMFLLRQTEPRKRDQWWLWIDVGIFLFFS
jgi:hypothetical protein